MLLRKDRCCRAVTIVCLAVLSAAPAGSVRGAAPAGAEQMLHEARQALDAGRWDDAARSLAVAEKASDDEEYQQRVAVCRRELFTVVRLDELRYDYPTNAYSFDREALSAAYRDTFRGYGLDPERADEEMKRRGRASPIRAQLIAALDEWARIFHVEDKRRGLLLDFASALDDSEQRRSVRAAVRDNDASRLRLLAMAADVKDLTPATLLLLERTLGLLGEWQASEELLRRGKEVLPPDFWILLHLGEQLAKDKGQRAQEGVRCLRAALAMRPDSLRAQCSLAMALWGCKQHVAAETVARGAIRTRPQWMEAHWIVVNLLEEQGKHAQADVACREASRLNNGNAAAQCLRGRLLGLREQWDDSEAVFRRVLRFEPDNAEAMAYLGAVLVARKNLREAEPLLREAMRRGAEWHGVPCALGVLLVQVGQNAEGEAQLREYLHYNPGDPSALPVLALAQLRLGHVVDADLTCREALRNAPDDRSAKYVLGQALLAEKMPAEAEALFREVLRVDDTDEDTWSSLGAALVMQKKLKEAEAHYRTALKRFPGTAQLYNDLGGVLAIQERYDEAESLLREALRLNSKHVQARSNLVELLKRGQRFEEARALLREAVAANPDDMVAWIALAEICSTSNSYQETETAARAVVRLTPDAPRSRFNLALALEMQGRFEAALAELPSLNPDVVAALPVARTTQDRLERMCSWERQLSALVRGAVRPADVAEALALARMCLLKDHPRAAIAFYEEAFRKSPEVMNDVEMCHRSLAAAAAVVAASKSGDEGPPTEMVRTAWRRQGLAWLRQELQMWSRLTEEHEDDRSNIRRILEHWQHATWFESVRGTKALEQLPAGERDGWAQLWRDVEALRQRCYQDQ